jgi:hypothetical protein
VDDLLRSISWHAEKLFRKRHHFASVLFLTETASGRRQLFETGCQAPGHVSDRQLLEALAREMYEDFAVSGVVRFAVAYLGNRVTVIKPLDPNSTMQPSTTRVKGVVIELHDANQSVRLFRPIIKPPRGQPVLAAADILDPPTDSPYFNLLPRGADVVATVH